MLATRLSFLTAVATIALGCVSHSSRSASDVQQHEAIIHAFDGGLDGTRAGNPAVRLRVEAEQSLDHEAVLVVEYPPPSSDPASRDVQLDAAITNWSMGRALSFRARPAAAIRLSVSFFDRNGVVYTSWTNLQAGAWQTVRIELATIRPNPYFQPPSAKVGAPLDVSDVKSLAFAPQDSHAGRLAITRVMLVE